MACYNALAEPKLLDYWHSHHDIPIPNCDNIDWEPSAVAVRRLPLGKKRWHFKFITGCIGVGNQLFHRRYQDHSKCPLCNADDERVSHVLHCPDASATSFSKTQIDHHLPETLEDIETEPVLAASLLTILGLWRSNDRIVPLRFHTSVRAILYQQAAIGWDNFVIGRWGPAWRFHQERYYSAQGSKRSSLRWAAAIIDKLLLVAWDLWQYRNGRLHAPDGPLARSLHLSLDAEIASEFVLGVDTLPVASRCLLLGRAQTEICKYPIHAKRMWLQSVCAARAVFATLPPPTRWTAQADFMHQWLNLTLNPSSADS